MSDSQNKETDKESFMLLSEQIVARRKRKHLSKSYAYINASFIIVSVAEAELYFSTEPSVLSKGQSNSSYWSLSTVSKSTALNRSSKVEQNIAEAQDV